MVSTSAKYDRVNPEDGSNIKENIRNEDYYTRIAPSSVTEGHVQQAAAIMTSAFDIEVEDSEEEENPIPIVEKVTSTRVRVVAPFDLPAQYRLGVRVSDEDGFPSYFDVIVPEGGVCKGRPFEASKYEPGPIEGGFSDDLCDCCDGCGSTYCWIGWCCTPFAQAAIMERLHLDWSGFHSPHAKHTFLIISLAFVLYLNFAIGKGAVHVYFAQQYSCNGGFHRNVYCTDQYNEDEVFVIGIFQAGMTVISLFIFFTLFSTRRTFRRIYNIPSSCFGDCATAYFCSPCATLQMYRHMKRSGHRPHRFETFVEAKIV